MRELYREQLDDVLADLAQMAQEVSSAVRSATTALLEADIHLAEQVISATSGSIAAGRHRTSLVRPACPAGPGRRRAADHRRNSAHGGRAGADG